MRISTFLKKIPYFLKICSLANKNNVELYLVGGVLRDIFLKKDKQLLDFDFCVQKNSLVFARKFARVIHSKLITLDKKQGSYRVILKKNDKVYTYDFTRLRGCCLREDLILRDFTINTLVLALAKPHFLKPLDLLGAKADLEKKLIRISEERVLIDDPLRILRAFSFLANYGFRIEKKTEALLKKHRKRLHGVSGERINEEIFKILSSPNSYAAVKKMSDLLIIDEAVPYITSQRGVPQGGYHHLDVWGHSLETLLRFELLYKRRFAKNEEMVEYLNRPVANKHKLIEIIKLACLLHDVGKPLASKQIDKKTIFHAHEKIGAQLIDKIHERLKLSLKEKDILKRLVFWHLRPGYLADQRYPSRRAVYRFFRDTKDEGAAVIILSLADWRATRGPLVDRKKRIRHEKVMINLIDYYFKQRRKKPLSKLLNGFDVMRKFNLAPCSLVGDILNKIKEEQALGHLTTKREAYALACKVIKKDKTKITAKGQKPKAGKRTKARRQRA